MKLILNNRTHWKTLDIRRFVIRALRSERPDLFTRGHADQTLACNIEYHDADDDPSCAGQTALGMGLIWLSLPKETVDKTDLAIVCFHEAAHTRGLDHDSMEGDPKYDRIGNWRELYAWAEDFPLGKKEPKAKTSHKHEPPQIPA